MALLLLKRLSARASSLGSAFRDGGRRAPFGTAAAIAGGVALYYYCSSPTVAQLDSKSEGGFQEPHLLYAFSAVTPWKWSEFKLQETTRVSHNTRLFRFSLDPNARLGLDVASFILTKAKVGEEGKKSTVIRPYTPISDPDAKGYFELMIKVYPDGKMSQHFASLKPGDVIEVRGPIQTLKYLPNMKKKIGMIAGGAGITPMLQVLRAILKNPDDKTEVTLLYANSTPDDILLKEELDRLSATHPNFKVFYTVSKPSENWRGDTGRISRDMVLKYLPSPAADTLIFVCGPPGMMNHISGDKRFFFQGKLSGILKDLGYTQKMVYKF